MICKDCQAPLWKGNKTGYCRKHVSAAMTGPEHGAKISAALRRKIALDPVYKQQCQERGRKQCATPKMRAAATEAAKRSGAWRKAAAAVTPEDYARAVKRSAETRLGWCPAELRDEYRELVYRRKFKAAEAREIILAQHEKNMAAFRRKLGAA